MPTLRFEGFSDDTFGETLHTKDDFDNCASGDPIEYLVKHGKDAVLVVGQYARCDECSWMISVASWDPNHEDRPLPSWPMRIEKGEAPYSPAFIIEAPEGVTVQCLTREARS